MNVYITFGQIHVHSVNGKTFDKDCIASIECKNYQDGRDKAFTYFNDKWHQAYIKEDFPKEHMQYYPRGIISVEWSNNG